MNDRPMAPPLPMVPRSSSIERRTGPELPVRIFTSKSNQQEWERTKNEAMVPPAVIKVPFEEEDEEPRMTFIPPPHFRARQRVAGVKAAVKTNEETKLSSLASSSTAPQPPTNELPPHAPPTSAPQVINLMDVFKACDALDSKLCMNDEEGSVNDDLLSMDTREEEEHFQMKRLGSWSTLPTDTLPDSFDAKDDDGRPIDPAILEQRRRSSGSRRKKVGFEYPPVSSLKQCPRPDPSDLERLFFTEEELDAYEADREATNATDDIEIVAISSLSRDHEEIPQVRGRANSDSSTMSTTGGGGGGFGNYVSTPRKWTKARPRSVSRGRAEATPPPTPSSTERKNERMIKSVQIFLRERSSGRGSS